MVAIDTRLVRRGNVPFVVLATICGAYLAALLVGGSVTLVNAPSPRLLSPILFPLTALLWRAVVLVSIAWR